MRLPVWRITGDTWLIGVMTSCLHGQHMTPVSGVIGAADATGTPAAKQTAAAMAEKTLFMELPFFDQVAGNPLDYNQEVERADNWSLLS